MSSNLLEEAFLLLRNQQSESRGPERLTSIRQEPRSKLYQICRLNAYWFLADIDDEVQAKAVFMLGHFVIHVAFD